MSAVPSVRSYASTETSGACGQVAAAVCAIVNAAAVSAIRIRRNPFIRVLSRSARWPRWRYKRRKRRNGVNAGERPCVPETTMFYLASRDNNHASIQEAIEFHLEGLKEHAQPIPAPSSSSEVVEVAA